MKEFKLTITLNRLREIIIKLISLILFYYVFMDLQVNLGVEYNNSDKLYNSYVITSYVIITFLQLLIFLVNTRIKIISSIIYQLNFILYFIDVLIIILCAFLLKNYNATQDIIYILNKDSNLMFYIITPVQEKINLLLEESLRLKVPVKETLSMQDIEHTLKKVPIENISAKINEIIIECQQKIQKLEAEKIIPKSTWIDWIKEHPKTTIIAGIIIVGVACGLYYYFSGTETGNTGTKSAVSKASKVVDESFAVNEDNGTWTTTKLYADGSVVEEIRDATGKKISIIKTPAPTVPTVDTTNTEIELLDCNLKYPKCANAREVGLRIESLRGEDSNADLVAEIDNLITSIEDGSLVADPSVPKDYNSIFLKIINKIRNYYAHPGVNDFLRKKHAETRETILKYGFDSKAQKYLGTNHAHDFALLQDENPSVYEYMLWLDRVALLLSPILHMDKHPSSSLPYDLLLYGAYHAEKQMMEYGFWDLLPIAV